MSEGYTFEAEWVPGGLTVRTFWNGVETPMNRMTYSYDFVKAVQMAGPRPRAELEVGVHFYALHAFSLPVGLRLKGDDGFEYEVEARGRGGRWKSVDGPPRAEISYDPDAISGTVTFLPEREETT